MNYTSQSAPDVKPGANFILDTSHPACNIEYNIDANPKTGVDRASVTFTMPDDAKFYQMWGHVHIAGYNISLYRGGSDRGKPLCTSHPVYGTDKANKPGNEYGYVVEMSRCDLRANPVVIRKGEEVLVQVSNPPRPSSVTGARWCTLAWLKIVIPSWPICLPQPLLCQGSL